MICSNVLFAFLALINIVDVLGVYNTETYRISPKSERIITQYKDLNYDVFNAGKVNVTVQLMVGIGTVWVKSIAQKELAPGERKRISISYGGYLFMGLKVINRENEYALVNGHAKHTVFPEYDNYKGSWVNFDEPDLAQTVITSMAEYVPFVGGHLATLIEYFWPSDRSVWDNIVKELQPILDDKIQKWIANLLTKEIHQFQVKIELCAKEIEEDPNYDKSGRLYLGTAEDMIGLERKFMDDDPNYNYLLFPLYSMVINLKLSFYLYGVENADEIGLDDYTLKRIKFYMVQLVNSTKYGAIDHVTKTCDTQINNNYKNTYPELLYNVMASTRQNCAVNGYEHLPKWKELIGQPQSDSDPPIFVYSTSFGRSSASQTYEIISLKSRAFTPIRHNYVQQIDMVTVYLTHKDYIGGLKVEYLDGLSASTGPKQEGNPVEIEFNGNWLMNLTVTGTGQISSLEFGFDDGSSRQVGTPEGPSRVFQLPCHYIAGFYGAGADIILDADQLANIAVSYVDYPCRG